MIVQLLTFYVDHKQFDQSKCRCYCHDGEEGHMKNQLN